MSRRTTSFTKAMCAVAVTVLFSGCGPGEGEAGSTAAAIGATGTLRQPGDLTSPIDDMTDGDLWTATDGLPTVATSTPQQRECGSPKKDCWGMIAAVDRTPPGPGNISAHGSVVAVLTNLGDAVVNGADVGAERVYETTMDPNKRFLLVAREDGAGKWRWEVRVAVNDGTTKPAATTESGKWSVCEETGPTDPTHPQGKKSAFYKCKKIKPDAAGGTTSVVANWLRDDPLAPGWLDCSAGCCTAGQ